MATIPEQVKAGETKLAELCARLKETAKEALELKKASANALDQTALKGLQAKGAFNLIDLKECNRNLHMLVEEHEKSIQPNKAALDDSNLQLQNFIYEQQQYWSSIRACKQFTSRHKRVQLADKKEYFAKHPEDRPMESDEHRLMLSRLNWELEERKSGEKTVQQLKEGRAKVQELRKSSEKFLEGLKESLKGVKESTKPMQEYLKVQVKERNKENKKAALLPSPLYILFQKWSAFASNSPEEKVVVKLNGHKSTVEPFNAALQKQLAKPDEAADEAGGGEPEKKKRKVEDPKDAKGNSDQGAQVAATDSHPLSVELAFDVRESDAEAGVCLKFHFVPVMNHVTVELALAKKAPAHFAWIGSAAVLRNLAPDDDGSAAPNPCTAYEVEAPAPPADGSRLPYKWLQWLAGYDFMFPIPQIPTSQTELCKSVGQVFNCRQRQSTAQVFKSIKERLVARVALCKQVESLKKKQFGNVTLAANVGKWQALEPVKFGSFEEVAAPGSTPGAPCLKKCLKVFKAVFQGEGYVFHATIEIPEDYPAAPSLITLACPTQPQAATKIPDTLMAKSDKRALDLLKQCAGEKPTNNALKHVEAEVNYNLPAHCAGGGGVAGDNYYLAKQVMLLMRCLDIFMHVELGKTDRMCLRASRGRDRSLPFNWNPTMKMFEH